MKNEYAIIKQYKQSASCSSDSVEFEGTLEQAKEYLKEESEYLECDYNENDMYLDFGDYELIIKDAEDFCEDSYNDDSEFSWDIYDSRNSDTAKRYVECEVLNDN